jgi:hypothetical protein
MDERQEWRHEATLPAEPASVFRARAFVCRHLLEHRLWHLVDPVRVVASELSTNAAAGADTSFTVSLWASGGRVYVAVRDGYQAEVGASADPGPRGRLRLTIVALLSEDWGVTPDGPRGGEVWASFAALPAPA